MTGRIGDIWHMVLQASFQLEAVASPVASMVSYRVPQRSLCQKYSVTIKEIDTFSIMQYQNRQRSGHTICVVAQRIDEIFFQAFFHDASTTSAPLTSLKQNGCYCGRAQVCLDRIRPSYLYLSCEKRLTHRTCVTSSYKLKNVYYKTM